MKGAETTVGRADLRERRESQCSRGGSETTITHDVYRSKTERAFGLGSRIEDTTSE
jgi:hypothetical protein